MEKLKIMNLAVNTAEDTMLKGYGGPFGVTFIDNVELTPKERRVISDGTLFTLGATSIILRTSNDEE